MWFATLWLTTVDITEKQEPVWVSDGIEVRTINGPSWGRTSDQPGRVDNQRVPLARFQLSPSEPCMHLSMHTARIIAASVPDDGESQHTAAAWTAMERVLPLISGCAE